VAGDALEFFDAALCIIASSNCLQIIANHLIQALAQRLRLLAGARDELVVEG